jgi:hypothetical protein
VRHAAIKLQPRARGSRPRPSPGDTEAATQDFVIDNLVFFVRDAGLRRVVKLAGRRVGPERRVPSRRPGAWRLRSLVNMPRSRRAPRSCSRRCSLDDYVPARAARVKVSARLPSPARSRARTTATTRYARGRSRQLASREVRFALESAARHTGLAVETLTGRWPEDVAPREQVAGARDRAADVRPADSARLRRSPLVLPWHGCSRTARRQPQPHAPRGLPDVVDRAHGLNKMPLIGRPATTF